MLLPTIEVYDLASGTKLIINERDFDASKYSKEAPKQEEKQAPKKKASKKWILNSLGMTI